MADDDFLPVGRLADGAQFFGRIGILDRLKRSPSDR